MERRYWWMESDTAARREHSWSGSIGSGSMQSLPMTESAKKRARKRPIGFTAELPPRKP